MVSLAKALYAARTSGSFGECFIALKASLNLLALALSRNLVPLKLGLLVPNAL